MASNGNINPVDVSIITEKKTVAEVVYKALNKGSNFTTHKYGFYGSWKGKSVFIGYTQGHIYTLLEPHDINPKFKQWSLDDLPFAVVNQFKVLERKEALESHVRKQIQKSSILVLSTDPDEQGVYIGELVRQMASFKGMTKRVGIKTYDPDRCRELFDKNFEDLPEYKPFIKIAQSEACRQRLDYAVGMNLSRLYSLTAQKLNQLPDGKLICGRVQTPVLSILVKRYLERKHFIPERFYTFHLRVTSGNRTIDFEVESERVFTTEQKDEISKKLINSELVITKRYIEKVVTPPPEPFKQDTLQIRMGTKYGYSANSVLEAANDNYQNGYQSYPRTDGNAIEYSEWARAKQVLPPVLDVVNQSLNNKLVDLDYSRTSSKVTLQGKEAEEAHTAILPTGKRWDQDTKGIKWDVYKEVVVRYSMMFLGNLVTEKTTIYGRCGEYNVKAVGEIILEDGWSLYDDSKRKIIQIPDIATNTSYPKKVVTKKSSTKIPPRLQSHDIVKELSNIGKHLPEEFEHLAKYFEKDENSGLGSSATKGPAIEQTIKHGLVKQVTDKKSIFLEPTPTGIAFYNALPKELTDISLFATWEKEFNLILKGSAKYADILSKNHKYIEDLVNTVKINPALFEFTAPLKITGYECPICHRPIEKKAGKFGISYFCQSCNKRFPDYKSEPLKDLDGHGDRCDKVYDGVPCEGVMLTCAGVSKKNEKAYKALRCSSKECKNFIFK
ncbi:DNA topoisomerase [Marinomonas sp. TI.3.20]|uniref:DNA topoisomerase n=1 Tax=Marinomonas sp. TI.3.20 TaxID=3121296 RepID=UPI00311FAD89